jgi:hypothetical protein
LISDDGGNVFFCGGYGTASVANTAANAVTYTPSQCDVPSLLAIDFQTRALILLNTIIYEINELR